MAETYIRSAAVSEQVLGKDLIVSQERSDAVHVLNGTASFIWGRLETPATPADVEASLREEYDMSAVPDVPGIIQTLLRDLEQKGLIERVSSAG